MPDYYCLTEPQLERIKPYFPRSHGKSRVDERRLISGIIHVIRNGLKWRDAPQVYGPHKTLYNRFVRWSRMGAFDRILGGVAGDSGEPDTVMIDATYLKAHRTAASLPKKWASPRRIGRTKGGLNSKLHALCGGIGRPLVLCLSEGQLSDHAGAKLIYPVMPNVKILIGDKGYDSDEFRDALKVRKIKACIPSRSNRIAPRHYSKTSYKQRHKIENMFAKLKDWRRIATRYDRCAHIFMSAICVAATVIFWISQ